MPSLAASECNHEWQPQLRVATRRTWVIDKLGRAAREALASSAVQVRLGKLGMRLQGSTPAELQALLGSEIQRWGAVIRAAKIEPE